MSNIFEKSINMGIGLFSYSKEKIEAFVDELVKKGDISQYDSKAIINDLIEKGEKQRQEIGNVIRDEITRTLDFMNIARKEDLIDREELRNIIREEIANVMNSSVPVKNQQNTNDKNNTTE